MSKKLFIFDMDGTLLNDKRSINEKSVYALNLAMQRGHNVVIATGRNFCQIEHLLNLFPEIKYVITINGGIITDVKNQITTIVSQPLVAEVKNAMCEVAQRLKRELQWSNDKCFYRVYFGNDPKVEVEDPNFFSSELVVYDDWQSVKHTINDDVLHMAVKCEKKFVLQEIPPLREKFEKNGLCTITETSKTYLDCDPVNVNKYNAVKKIQELLGHSSEDVHAFGDSLNDYLMIKNVGNGVAMGNAREEVKDIAKHVIGTNNSDAIADYVLKEINYE